MKIWPLATLAILLASAISAVAQNQIYDVNGRIPLGVESFMLQPGGSYFYLMASAEDSEFHELYRATDKHGHPQLFDGKSKQVSFYPSHVEFRLTASTREKLFDERPWKTHSSLSVDSLLTKLRFRLKIFHALEYWYVKPAFVENVGVPPDIEYDERIYRIGFDLGRIPVEDRIVMEVFSPTGERLCKFHLDLL